MDKSEKTSNPLMTFAGLAGALGGWGLSHYAGLALWVPGVTTILLLVLLNRMQAKPRYYLEAIAIMAGHLVLFVVASVMAGAWSQTIVDILLLLVAVAWLWMRPVKSAAVTIGLVQSLALIFTIVLWSKAAIGSVEHKVLTVHCVWRILAIAALATGVWRIRREQAIRLSVPLNKRED